MAAASMEDLSDLSLAEHAAVVKLSDKSLPTKGIKKEHMDRCTLLFGDEVTPVLKAIPGEMHEAFKEGPSKVLACLSMQKDSHETKNFWAILRLRGLAFHLEKSDELPAWLRGVLDKMRTAKAMPSKDDLDMKARLVKTGVPSSERDKYLQDAIQQWALFLEAPAGTASTSSLAGFEEMGKLWGQKDDASIKFNAPEPLDVCKKIQGLRDALTPAGEGEVVKLKPVTASIQTKEWLEALASGFYWQYAREVARKNSTIGIYQVKIQPVGLESSDLVVVGPFRPERHTREPFKLWEGGFGKAKSRPFWKIGTMDRKRDGKQFVKSAKCMAYTFDEADPRSGFLRILPAEAAVMQYMKLYKEKPVGTTVERAFLGSWWLPDCNVGATLVNTQAGKPSMQKLFNFGTVITSSQVEALITDAEACKESPTCRRAGQQLHQLWHEHKCLGKSPEWCTTDMKISVGLHKHAGGKAGVAWFDLRVAGTDGKWTKIVPDSKPAQKPKRTIHVHVVAVSEGGARGRSGGDGVELGKGGRRYHLSSVVDFKDEKYVAAECSERPGAAASAGASAKS